MKKHMFILFTFCIPSVLHAQEEPADTSWKRGGVVGLTFNQVNLSNWAAGGQNSISAIGLINYFANYNDGKNIWDNSFDFGYGLTQNGDADPIKSEDKIDMSTKYGRHAYKHWYYSALLGFKSQFTAGYNYPNDSVKISDFLAPAYISLALGADYKPNDNFTLMISPAAGRLILVNDKRLADAGAFGVDKAEYDSLGVKTKNGASYRYEFGGMLKMVYNKEILENINFTTKIELFSNYIEEPENVDINWEILVAMKVNKYISATLSTQLIYDDNTIISLDKNNDGIIDESGPRTQFKEVLGIGLSYKF